MPISDLHTHYINMNKNDKEKEESYKIGTRLIHQMLAPGEFAYIKFQDVSVAQVAQTDNVASHPTLDTAPIVILSLPKKRAPQSPRGNRNYGMSDTTITLHC